MGKTKEMLIAMQEEMMMDWQHDMLTGLHEDLEVEEEMLVKLPTRSSDTSSEPVQTIDTERLVKDLYDVVLDFVTTDRIKYNFQKEQTMQEIQGVLRDHGIQTGSQTSLASQLRKSLDEKNLK